MVNKNKALGLITAGLLLVSFFMTIVLKSYNSSNKNTQPQEVNVTNLLQLELENEQMAKENKRLATEMTQVQAGQSAEMLASQQLAGAIMNAGQVAVTGKGIRITLDDSIQDRDSEASNYVIHEEYLRTIVNALWNGGAEAIAVNNQRLTTHSEIFCNGSFIQINGTRQMPPYEIIAIGNQNNLNGALQFYLWDKLGEYQQLYGITRKLESPAEPLNVPAAKTYEYQYAEPVKED